MFRMFVLHKDSNNGNVEHSRYLIILNKSINFVCFIYIYTIILYYYYFITTEG